MSDANSARTLIIGLVLLAHTGVGILGGIALDRLVFRPDQLRAAPLPRLRPGAEGFRPGLENRMLDALSRDLGLTARQREQVDSIFQSRAPAYRAVREQFEPRLRGLMEETRASIESILTSAQVERFRERHQRHVGRMGERRGPGWPSGNSPGYVP
jgi:Spy/CpxP family protein refolding chaperone